MRILAILLLCFFPPSRVAEAPPSGRILMVGDSMFAWNKLKGSGVGRELQKALGRKVVDRSRSGAHMTVAKSRSGDPRTEIVSQYRAGPWSWVVINGGANDLLFECGCGRCARVLEDMLTPDLRNGAIAGLIEAAIEDGAKVMLVGYHAGRSGGHLFSGCRQDVTELVARQRRIAKARPEVYFVSARDALDSRNPAHFALDRVHPSSLGSKLIAQEIADGIRKAEQER